MQTLKHIQLPARRYFSTKLLVTIGLVESCKHKYKIATRVKDPWRWKHERSKARDVNHGYTIGSTIGGGYSTKTADIKTKQRVCQEKSISNRKNPTTWKDIFEQKP
jgi:hypothetical protein